MNNPLSVLLHRHYSEERAKMLLEIDDLLQSYGVTDHIDAITSLLNTPTSEDHYQLTLEIDGILKESCHHILLSLYIVPTADDLSEYHMLIKALYKLENSFDSGMIIELIDEVEEPAHPRDVLTTLLVDVCDIDWVDVQEVLSEVRQSLIDSLRELHANKLVDNPEEYDSGMPQERLNAAITYFTNNADTVTKAMVGTGLLTVPCENDKVLRVMTPALYKMRDPLDIAKELLAMAIIQPITLTSVPVQAKRLNNELFVDERLIVEVTLKIDAIVRNLPIFK